MLVQSSCGCIVVRLRSTPCFNRLSVSILGERRLSCVPMKAAVLTTFLAFSSSVQLKKPPAIALNLGLAALDLDLIGVDLIGVDLVGVD